MTTGIRGTGWPEGRVRAAGRDRASEVGEEKSFPGQGFPRPLRRIPARRRAVAAPALAGRGAAVWVQ